MSRYHSYLSSATAILSSYDGAEPFVHYSRKFFAANKKFGSRDRKTVAALCYSYFRCFHIFQDESMEQRILNAVFICEDAPNELLATLAPNLNDNIQLPVEQKLKQLGKAFKNIMPQLEELSDQLSKEQFAYSFMRQPQLYLRIRPGKQQAVFNKLNEAQLQFALKGEDCVALKNATSLETILKINRDVLVQDANSQRVFDFLLNQDVIANQNILSAWDCCAASGGKSILLYDRTASKVQLTVSDIRKSILHNLEERLRAAGVPIYRSFMADLLKGPPVDTNEAFDLVVCDAPCTGSGTWSRTPEQLAFFKTNMIEEYAAKQVAIAGNAAALLKKGGLFFYITCSVFEKENEQVVSKLQKLHSMKLLHQQYYEGYQMQADTLFVAVLSH